MRYKKFFIFTLTNLILQIIFLIIITINYWNYEHDSWTSYILSLVAVGVIMIYVIYLWLCYQHQNDLEWHRRLILWPVVLKDLHVFIFFIMIISNFFHINNIQFWDTVFELPTILFIIFFAYFIFWTISYLILWILIFSHRSHVVETESSAALLPGYQYQPD